MNENYHTEVIRRSDRKKFYMLSGPRCKKCGEINEAYPTCYDCEFSQQLEHIDGAIFFGYYDQESHSTPLSKELLGFKNYPKYADGLSELLYLAYKNSEISVNCLVPVPKRIQKGSNFNPASLLAIKLGNRIGCKVIDVLFFNRKTEKMTTLNKAKRKENVDGAISLEGNIDLSGEIVGVVDDIFTTGTTINECAKILKMKADARIVYGLCAGRSVPGYERDKLC